MLTGDQIRTARERAGWTQAHLGDLVGVSMRSIGNYERGETIPRNKMPVLKEVLAPYLGGDGPSLLGASDAQLLAEIARRFDRGTERQENDRGNTTPTSPAGEDRNLKAAYPIKGSQSKGRQSRQQQDDAGEESQDE